MPLDYENLPENQRHDLLHAGTLFLQTLASIAGAELTYEMWSQLADVVSPVYRQQMLIHLLTGERIGNQVSLAGTGPQKIEIINTIRTYTDLGLKDCMDIVDNATIYRPSKILVSDHRNRKPLIDALRALGCTVVL